MTDQITVRGEDTLRTTAAIGGRRITLDPIRVLPISLEIREVESTIPCGFQQHWGEVDADGKELTITAGAGMGNQWGTIQFDGKSYCWSVTQIVEAFLNAVKEVPVEG